MMSRGRPGHRRTRLALLATGVQAVLALLAIPASARASQTPCDVVATSIAASIGTNEDRGGPLDRRISLHVRDVALRDALDRVSALGGVPLAYSPGLLPLDRRVCVNADGQTIGALLAHLLRGTNVEPRVVASHVVLAPTPATATTAPSLGMSVLDRVVVTGSAVAAPRRPLSIGMEVIDGEQLRRQSYSSLADMLDASVPGVWMWPSSPSTLLAQYGALRGASSFGTSAPKIYLDGIEVANPLLVTQVDAESIDRIEVIRGPQGSALYGSDAISGVINIITRHDGAALSTGSLQLQLQSTAGAAASRFAGSVVPTHDQHLVLRSGTNIRSAGLSAEFGQTGALFPSSQSRQLSMAGDARLVASQVTVSAAAHFAGRDAGAGVNPLFASGGAASTATSTSDTAQSVRQYGFGVTAAFAPVGRWTSTLVAGLDGYHLDHVADTAIPFASAVDSALRAARGSGDRATLRASSVAQFGADGLAPTSLTLALEQSVLRQTSTLSQVAAPSQGQRFGTASNVLVERWNRNTGVAAQLSTALNDALFLTAGLRVERNDAFLGGDRFPVLPLLGVATVRRFGEAELKLRLAYGKGIRPPQVPARGAARIDQPGGILRSALDPEAQSGIEAGAELYLGRSLSLQLTRFDQRATGLIQNVAVAVDTQMRGGMPERRVIYTLQNIGEITNRGWEAQTRVTHGPLALSASVTTVDSRVRTVAASYYGELRPGDRMLAVPHITSSATASWTDARWSAALTASRAQDWINYDRLALASAFAAPSSASPRDFTGPRLRSYWLRYDGQMRMRASLSRDLGRGLSALAIGENLLGGQLGEPDNGTIRAGRTISAGLRAAF